MRAYDSGFSKTETNENTSLEGHNLPQAERVPQINVHWP